MSIQNRLQQISATLDGLRKNVSEVRDILVKENGYDEAIADYMENALANIDIASDQLLFSADMIEERGITMSKKMFFTRNKAAEIVDLFEEILDKHGIVIPSPEDDEREPDNEAKLYGSVYGDLLDEVEDKILQSIAASNGAEIVAYMFE